MGRSDVRREVSAGGVIFRLIEGIPRFLLILDGHGNWGFPKGHLAEAEEPLDAAIREIGEETGLGDLVLLRPLGSIDWYFRFRGRLIHKHCHFYLFESAHGQAVPQREEGITACEWFAQTEATARLSYQNSRDVLRQAGGIVDEFHRPGSAASGP